MKLALVHDYLIQNGGAEKVLLTACSHDSLVQTSVVLFLSAGLDSVEE